MSVSKYDLIRTPVVTEKSTFLGEVGQYVFKVAVNATKSSIKNSIQDIFLVKVKSVNVLNQEGKKKRFKGVLGRRASFKKAFVTLEKGYEIDFSNGGN